MREIWNLADRSQDGRLNADEFSVAMHLIVCISKRGLPLPASLPIELENAVYSTNVSTLSHVNLDMQSPHCTKEARDPMEAFNGLPMNHELSSDFVHKGQPSVEAPSSLPGHPTFSSIPVGPERASFSGFSSAIMGNSFTSPGGMTSLPSTPISSTHGSYPDISTTAGGSNPLGIHVASTAPVDRISAATARRMSSSSNIGSKAEGFLSQESERFLVKQLEESNEQVHAKLLESERKQLSVESLIKKIREIDRLRQELVTLSIRRDKAREAKKHVAGRDLSTQSAEHAKAQAEIAKNLEEMIQNERQLIEKLQKDIAGLETMRASTVYPNNLAKDASFGSIASCSQIPVMPSTGASSASSQGPKLEMAEPPQLEIEKDPFFASFPSQSTSDLFNSAISSSSAMGNMNDAFANFGFE